MSGDEHDRSWLVSLVQGEQVARRQLSAGHTREQVVLHLVHEAGLDEDEARHAVDEVARRRARRAHPAGSGRPRW